MYQLKQNRLKNVHFMLFCLLFHAISTESRTSGAMALGRSAVRFRLSTPTGSLKYRKNLDSITFSRLLLAMEIIVTGLAFHSAGVFLYQLSTKTNKKDRPYTAFAYLPKVTTQNVLAAVPLSIELPCRNIIQSAAVFGILTTAPLVAILMDVAKNILLK